MTFAQEAKSKTGLPTKNFSLYYAMAGMGSNMGAMMPTLHVENTRFTYTNEQNSYSALFPRNNRKEFISKGILRQSSIDSILVAVKGLEDSAIFRVNHCIWSGAIIIIIVANGPDTTKFTLWNTFDLAALKRINIINSYLPAQKGLPGSLQDIKDEEACWANMKKRIAEYRNDSTKRRDEATEAVEKINPKSE